MKLNIGCGHDLWGDVRLDVAFKFLYWNLRPNFIGDAQNLPFRDLSFSEVKASHVIEHLPLWRQALSEWSRVCNKLLIVKFPVDDGFKRPVILGCLNLDRTAIRDAIMSRKLRSHYWIIDPAAVRDLLKSQRFDVKIITNRRPIFPAFGRKGRLLSKLFKKNKLNTIKYEYEIIALRVS